MSKNQTDLSFPRSNLKTPFLAQNTQNNYSEWFSDPQKPEDKSKKDNDWNIDYCLSSTKEDNPFSTAKSSIAASNKVQYERNIDLFLDRNEPESVQGEKEETKGKDFFHENEVNDDNDELLMELKEKKENDQGSEQEYMIYEDRAAVIKEQENLNFGSGETLNLVESDGESKNELPNRPLIEKNYQKSGFQPQVKPPIQTSPPEKCHVFGNEVLEEVDLDLNQISSSRSKIKDESSLYESRFSMNVLPIFNFNFGWTFLQSVEEKSVLFSTEKTLETRIAKVVRDFPGPIRIEKNANYITHTYNRLFSYMNGVLNEKKKESIDSLSRKFVWTLLNEMLLNKKVSIYELMGSAPKFRENLISFIESSFLGFYDHNINMEVFKNEMNYLMNLLNLSDSQYHDLIEDDQWETIFFAKLFLTSEKTQIFAKDVKDIMSHYIERTYKKCYPMHVFTLLKIGRADKFYEDSALMRENPMLYVWLLLKTIDYLGEEAWHVMLKILFYLLNDTKKDPFIQLGILIMCMGFDNEDMPKLIAQNNSPDMIQMMETFFFLSITMSNFQFDSPRYLYKNLFPAFLAHSCTLAEQGLHERAIEYVNLVESSKNYFFSLEKNRLFMGALREIKQRLIANVDIIYGNQGNNQIYMILEREKAEKNAGFTDFRQNLLQNQSFNNNAAQNSGNTEKEFSTNLKKNFFSYFNSAVGMFKGPTSNEKNVKRNEIQSESEPPKNKDFYYDEKLKTWVLNGVPAQEGNDLGEPKEKEKITEKEEVPLPIPILPQMKRKEETQNPEREKNPSRTETESKESKTENAKANQIRVGGNPFNNPFANNDSDTTSEGSIPAKQQNKRVLQNRYVHYK